MWVIKGTLYWGLENSSDMSEGVAINPNVYDPTPGVVTTNVLQLQGAGVQ